MSDEHLTVGLLPHKLGGTVLEAWVIQLQYGRTKRVLYAAQLRHKLWVLLTQGQVERRPGKALLGNRAATPVWAMLLRDAPRFVTKELALTAAGERLLAEDAARRFGGDGHVRWTMKVSQ